MVIDYFKKKKITLTQIHPTVWVFSLACGMLTKYNIKNATKQVLPVPYTRILSTQEDVSVPRLV